MQYCIMLLNLKTLIAESQNSGEDQFEVNTILTPLALKDNVFFIGKRLGNIDLNSRTIRPIVLSLSSPSEFITG